MFLVAKNLQQLSKDNISVRIYQSEESQAKVASSLLCAISDIFCRKIVLSLEEFPEIRSIAFVGGVACNQYIRKPGTCGKDL